MEDVTPVVNPAFVKAARLKTLDAMLEEIEAFKRSYPVGASIQFEHRGKPREGIISGHNVMAGIFPYAVVTINGKPFEVFQSDLSKTYEKDQ